MIVPVIAHIDGTIVPEKLRGRLWKAKAVFTLFNKVRRLCSQLLGLATVIVAHFSQGLFRSAAAHQVGLRMEHFGDF